MIGHIEKDDLSSSEQERCFHARDLLRHWRGEHSGDDVFERPEPPQHGGREHAHQSAIAVFQRLQGFRLLFQFVVEGAAAPQHAFKNGGSDLPRGQTGNRCGTGRGLGHAPSLRTKWRRRRVYFSVITGPPHAISGLPEIGIQGAQVGYSRLLAASPVIPLR